MRPRLWISSFAALAGLAWLGAQPGGVGAAERQSPPAPDTTATTVIVVRHAEKDTTLLGSDPPLTAAGMLRARELARALSEAEIAAIYVTPWQRNRQTAQPLATRLGDSLIVVDPIDETVRRVRSHRGQTVLVVGHSNTIPRILRELTGRAVPDSLPVHYDDLWVVTLAPSRPATLLKLHYGAPGGAPR